jgi:hypothetical protein
MWDKEKAISVLRANAPVNQPSLGLCALYTRLAIEAGGIKLNHHISAKDYGSSLLAVGFVKVPTGHYMHQAGDVGIVRPIPSHPHGHMAMFDGAIWISDFRQHHGLYPGQKYRQLKPGYDIYRYQLLWDSAAKSAMSLMA